MIKKKVGTVTDSMLAGRSVAILTPLAVEYQAVRKVIEDPSEPRSQKLPTTIGKIGQHTVVCVLSGKGESNTAAALQHVFHEWGPRWVLLVGVAAGLADLQHGDVIIGTFVCGLDFGKLVSGRFVRRPEYDFSPDRSLLAFAELTSELDRDSWHKRILARRPDKRPARTSRVHAGYIGSGDKVVDDPKHPIFEAAVATIPELHAIEMEAVGAGASLRLEQSMRTVGALMIRGISDTPGAPPPGLGGSEQRSKWKGYAAAAAAAFVAKFLHRLPEYDPDSHADESRAGAATFSHSPSIDKASALALGHASSTGRQDAESVSDLATILVPYQAQGIFMAAKPGRKLQLYNDSGEGLLTIIEELLALGCLKVAVSHDLTFDGLRGRVPALQDRLIHVDSDRSIFRRAVNLLGPVAEELRVPEKDFYSDVPAFPAQHRALINEKRHPRREKIASLSYAFENLYVMLIGLHYGLQVAVDVDIFARRVNLLRDSLRSPDARMGLSSIAGLLKTYKSWNVQTLAAKREDDAARSQAFRELIRNQTFAHLSRQAYLLGVPLQAHDAASNMSVLVSELTRAGKGVTGVAAKTRIFKGSAGFVDPQSELEQEVISRAFIPPIVPLKGIVWKAFQRWARRLPAGHKPAALTIDGVDPYFPEAPKHWKVMSLSKDELQVTFLSMEAVNPFDLELLEVVMAEGAICPAHDQAPEVCGQYVPDRGVLFSFSFCCERQAELFFERWELVS